jgi:hypothetical protein
MQRPGAATQTPPRVRGDDGSFWRLRRQNEPEKPFNLIDKSNIFV